MSFTRLDCYQYLLSSPINYTITNVADHRKGVNHDRINRCLRGEKLSACLSWDNVKGLLHPSPSTYLLFDNTVLDKHA